MNRALPTGTVTFLYTDIKGSATLWERDPAAMHDALDLHNRVLHEAMAAHGGCVYKIIGDAFQVAFEQPLPALCAALDAQRSLAAAEWGPIGPLQVRMGIHRGRALEAGAARRRSS